MSSIDEILQHKIVAILRGVNAKDVLNIANALYTGGVRIVEITLNTKDALSQIEQLADQLGDRMFVGAGTVLDKKDAKNAAKAGAKFLISPMLDADVVAKTKDLGLISIPGAYTATEVFQAYKAGADIVKLFPVSNPDYVKALLAPLDHIRVMPTGGINVHNIRQFKDSGAVAFGIGSSLVSTTSTVGEAYLNTITERAAALVDAIKD